jgi:TniQ
VRERRSRVVAWSPAELPCAPRPINGEILSSWLRRVAAANDLTLPEIEACIGAVLGGEAPAVSDFRPPKEWRRAVAALTRVPERWIWVLGLDQHFPGAVPESFVHERTTPYGMGASFCPECFRDQIAQHRPLHMKAEWTLATTTRCFVHHLPLYLHCPWCGHDDPVHFRGSDVVECLDCEHDLTIRRWQWRMPIFEPLIARFEQVIAEAFAGKAPHPGWAGEISAVSFRRLVTDLIWMLTTETLGDAYLGLALVDRIRPSRFAFRQPYGWDFATPFLRRCAAEREAVIAGMILVMGGTEADRALGVGDTTTSETAEFRPFVDMLRAVRGKEETFWTCIRRWPGDLQDRAGRALRYLRLEEALTRSACPAREEKRSASVGEIETGALGRTRVQVAAGRRNRGMTERRLHQVDRRAAIERVARMSVPHPMG